MLTRMTDEDWATVLEVFRGCRFQRGAKGQNDRIFLKRCITSAFTTSLGAPCRPRAGTGIQCGSASGA